LHRFYWLEYKTAKKGIATFDAIIKLQKATDEKLQSLASKTSVTRTLVNALYKNPFTNAAHVARVTGASPPAAYSLLSELEGLGILEETTGGKRGRKYFFKEYLDLIRS